MGIFDTPKMRDGDIRELHGSSFRLMGAAVRDEVMTRFGPTKAVDLFVDPTGEASSKDDESVLLYSGFSAGIAHQVERASSRDFPVWAHIEEFPFGKGTSTKLAFSDGKTMPLPETSDDDIPF